MVEIRHRYTGHLIFSDDSASLRNTDLTDMDLREANLRNADLRGASLRNTDLTDANLRNADLTNANLRNADLTDTNLHTYASGFYTAVIKKGTQNES